MHQYLKSSTDINRSGDFPTPVFDSLLEATMVLARVVIRTAFKVENCCKSFGTTFCSSFLFIRNCNLPKPRFPVQAEQEEQKMLPPAFWEAFPRPYCG
jgi:hypothetical protein